MKKYLVSYDLVKPHRDYANLYAALAKLKAGRVLLSQWVVVTTLTAVQLRDHLRQHMDADDRLLVNDFGDWASYNLLLDLNRAA